MASTVNRRLELHKKLVKICPNCYFQPPANKKLQYPCIIYKRTNNSTYYGDNDPYMITTRYQLIVVDKDPDSTITPEIEKLRMCTFDRNYSVDNLHHDVFTIYY